MSNKNDLNGLLESFDKKRELGTGVSENANLQPLVKPKAPALVNLPKASLDNTNIIDRFRANSLRSSKELEAETIVLNDHISILTHESEAKIRLSKTFWDGESVAIAEKIKTNVQSNLRDTENERLTDRDRAIIEANERSYKKMEEVMEKDLPDMMKRQLLEQLDKNLHHAMERINNDSIAEKYDLK